MDSFIPATPPSPPMTASTALIHHIDQLLPQTQCRRCGYDDCHAYAQAIASGEAAINRCPPGSDATIAALSQLLGRPALPLAGDLDPMPVRHVVHIDPLHCIGCTKCILACPVDAIVGAPRFQHQVLADRCTGCELCLPPCPVDCISLVPVQQPWQDADARHGRHHHQRREHRLQARRTTARPVAPAAAWPAGPGVRAAGADMPEEAGKVETTGTPAVAGRVETSGTPAVAGKAETTDTTAVAGAGGTSRPTAAAASAPGVLPPQPSPGTLDAHPDTYLPPVPDTSAASRDPNIALASTDEKARRLAAIRARMKPARPRPAAE